MLKIGQNSQNDQDGQNDQYGQNSQNGHNRQNVNKVSRFVFTYSSALCKSLYTHPFLDSTL